MFTDSFIWLYLETFTKSDRLQFNTSAIGHFTYKCDEVCDRRICRTQFTLLVNDVGFEKSMRLHELSRYIPIQSSYYAKKKTQMPLPSNHFHYVLQNQSRLTVVSIYLLE